MAENNIAGFKKLMRYAQNLAEYEQGIAEGIIDENVFVIVLDEKVAKFKGQTFDWNTLDISSLATKEELTNLQNEIIANEEVVAAAFNEVNERLDEIGENIAGEAVTKEEFSEAIEGINGSLEGKADASAINDLQTSINGINESLSGYVTSDTLSNEITNIQNEIIANEEVHAAALTDLDARINNIITRLNNAGL